MEIHRPRFLGSDGAQPDANLILDGKRNLSATATPYGLVASERKTFRSSRRLCPSVTQACNPILRLADYNKLIFPKGLSQRGQSEASSSMPEPDAPG